MNKINKDFIFKDNPRKITDKQLSRLESDLRKFGDLSGVVYCRKNKAYVGGNQRSKIFDGSQITIIKEYDERSAECGILLNGRLTHRSYNSVIAKSSKPYPKKEETESLTQ